MSYWAWSRWLNWAHVDPDFNEFGQDYWGQTHLRLHGALGAERSLGGNRKSPDKGSSLKTNDHQTGLKAHKHRARSSFRQAPNNGTRNLITKTPLFRSDFDYKLLSALIKKFYNIKPLDRGSLQLHRELGQANRGSWSLLHDTDHCSADLNS